MLFNKIAQLSIYQINFYFNCINAGGICLKTGGILNV